MPARYDPVTPPGRPTADLWKTCRLRQHDGLEVVGLALEPDAFVEGDCRGVEVVDVQRQVGVAVEGEVAAGGHGGGADAVATELGGDVDALDLRGLMAGAADVNLELELAGRLVDVGPAAGDEHADAAPVAVGVAGHGVLAHLLGVHGGGQLQHPVLVGPFGQPGHAWGPAMGVADQAVGVDGVDELAAPDLAGGGEAGADEGPEELDRVPFADHHAGRVEAAGGGGQSLAGVLVLGGRDQVGADVEEAAQLPLLERAPQGAGAEGGQGAVVEDAAGDEDVPDGVAV